MLNQASQRAEQLRDSCLPLEFCLGLAALVGPGPVKLCSVIDFRHRTPTQKTPIPKEHTSRMPDAILTNFRLNKSTKDLLFPVQLLVAMKETLCLPPGDPLFLPRCTGLLHASKADLSKLMTFLVTLCSSNPLPHLLLLMSPSTLNLFNFARILSFPRSPSFAKS